MYNYDKSGSGIARPETSGYNETVKRKDVGRAMAKAPHILICDDQPIIHETVGVYLDNEGFTHASAYNGTDALKLAQE